MLDRRNIMRGACKDCGKDECAEYERNQDETSNNCGYCCCPVTIHEKGKYYNFLKPIIAFRRKYLRINYDHFYSD